MNAYYQFRCASPTPLRARLSSSWISPRITRYERSLRLTSFVEWGADIYAAQNRLKIIHGGTIASMVDLGGSLAVASMGLYATGVSTDLNVTYLSGGGKVGETIKATATCDKSKSRCV